MNVLDELRDAIGPSEDHEGRTNVLTKSRALDILDAFEAAHPNLTECSITSCAAHKDVTP